jgi:hypothetical protein
MKLYRLRSSVLLLVIALVPSVQAQVPPEVQITGRIARADKGTPIDGALVQLFPWGDIGGNPRTAKTDNSGEYYFQGLKPGNYMISASADGFVSAEYRRDASLEGAMLKVDTSTQLQGIDLRLTPEAVIRGVVIDMEGRPVGQGVSVAAVRRETGEDGSERLVPISDGLTGEVGQFALKKLPAGSYFVCVDGPSGHELHPDPGGWYQESWYGDKPSEKGALLVSLKEAGEQNGIRIRVQRETRHKVIIWPSGLESGPAANSYDLNFSLLERDTLCMRQPDGSYMIPDIPAGHFTLVSEVWSRSKFEGRKETSFDIIDGNVNLHIDLADLGKIENSVQ